MEMLDRIVYLLLVVDRELVARPRWLPALLAACICAELDDNCYGVRHKRLGEFVATWQDV
jgi:hypothetical protein